MPNQPETQPYIPIYRLVVTASQLKAKQFVWVIMDDTYRGIPVQTSQQTFRSMDDAYNAGKDALDYWRWKARRVHPPEGLAQPSKAKPPVQKAPEPRGPVGL
jgi:hypothetical protein